jgi:hypothetical protein
MRHPRTSRFNRRCAAAAAVLAAAIATAPANACRMYAPFHVEDVRYADVVVVGRIANYRIVRDTEFRRKMLKSPHLRPEDREFYESGTTLLPDYARFDVEVDQILFGTAPRRLAVTWDNSTYGEPETMAAGPFLIALRRPASATAPLRGPSATIWPSREPGTLTVLQAPCSGAFILESQSDQARTIRRILSARSR